MAGQARQLHYVSRFHLAGFTLSGRPNGRLYVLDQGQVRQWPTTPANAASQRDFYAVNLGPQTNPNIVETILSILETEFSRVCRDIVTNKRLPKGKDFNYFLNFVGLAAVRVPRIRQLMRLVVDNVCKDHLRRELSSDDGWNRIKGCFTDQLHGKRDDELQQIREFGISQDYTVDMEQTYYVLQMQELVGALLPELAKRNWSLGISASDAPDFVCSDVPLKVRPLQGVQISDSRDLRNPNTLLSFPINRRMIAIARFEPIPPLLTISKGGVAILNSSTISEARHVFSAEQNFVYMAAGKQIAETSDLLQSLKGRAGRYSNLEEAFKTSFANRRDACESAT